MDQPLRAGGVFCRLHTPVLFFALAGAFGCTKELAQPVLQTETAPVGNSLRAPAPIDPKAKQGRVGMPERRWGTREDGSKYALNTTKAVLEAQAKSLNNHPEGLQRAQLQGALDAQMGNLARCFDNVSVTQVGVYFEADPSGEARGIQVRGAPPAAQDCVTNLIRGLKIPQFEGHSVPVDFPLSISQRVETVTTTAQPSNEARPKTFVNP